MDTEWPLDPDRKFESPHFILEALKQKQQENAWLREGGPDREDDWYPSYDYSYTAYECLTVDELRRAFLYGNWAIRQCFTYKNLAFINQVNAGDEWWALKKFEDGVLLAFESITMIAVIYHAQDYFSDYIEQLLNATQAQCAKLEYTSDEFNKKYESDSGSTTNGILRVNSS
ncbi:unnamed protein product, partial [marine sediment metagenome]